MYPNWYNNRAELGGLLPYKQHLLRACFQSKQTQKHNSSTLLALVTFTQLTHPAWLRHVQLSKILLHTFLLPEIISKEPLGPLVRHGDDQWGDIVRWTLNALVAAEELGVTSANVAESAAAAGNNPEVNRLLGTEGNLGEQLGLSADWAKNAIMAGGNYGEIFSKNIGESTPIGLARGLNAQWTDGGLIYTPPFR